MPLRSFRLPTGIVAGFALGLSVLSASFADARPAQNYHYAKDLSDLHGFDFDYSPLPNARGMWGAGYDHNEIDRDFGYAQRLHLNAIRTFVSYREFAENKDQYRSQLIDYVRLANAHGMGVMLTLPAGVVGGPPSKDVNLDADFKSKVRAFAQFLVHAVGNGKEPGLAFWDVANEPDFVKPPLIIMHESTTGEVTREPSHAHASPPGSDQPHNEVVAQYMATLFHELDHHTPITVGCMMPTACLQQAAKYVDVLSFHDYSQTVAQADANIRLAQQVAASVHKPVIDTEMGCIARADPNAMEIEQHDKYHTGWMITQIMFTKAWPHSHGFFYPDGSVRNPDDVAAILGFFRYHGPNPVLEEPDMEGIVSGVLSNARSWQQEPNPDWFKGLVIAETEANALETGQLAAMRIPPTSEVYKLRAGAPNIPALRLLIAKFSAELAPSAIPGTIPLNRYYTPVVTH